MWLAFRLVLVVQAIKLIERYRRFCRRRLSVEQEEALLARVTAWMEWAYGIQHRPELSVEAQVLRFHQVHQALRDEDDEAAS